MSFTKRWIEENGLKAQIPASHKLDLYENALDSFNEALKRFKDGTSGNIKA